MIAVPKAKEAVPSRPKRSVRRNYGTNSQPGSNGFTVVDSERPRRSLKKTCGPAAQESPQTELEKVKRSLRKVSGATGETCDSVEVENEKLKHDLAKIPTENAKTDDVGTATDVSQREEITKPIAKDSRNGSANDDDDDDDAEDCAGNTEEDAQQSPDQEQAGDGPVDGTIEGHPSAESRRGQVNGELTSEERGSAESQRGSKRRASFSARPEHADSGLQSAPVLPSYMAATQSAKAKFCGQDSPRLGSDGVDKAAFTRRHSLPSGRPASVSPRTQRPVQGSCKAGVRGERSLLS